MNTYDYEKTAEYNRQRAYAEINQIRLEQTIVQSRSYQPGRFVHIMFNFANWMIAAGKQLRRRYEVPISNCNNAGHKHFSH